MLYQSILNENAPYVARVAPLGVFQRHRHHEIEIIYCISGSFILKTEKTAYNVEQGNAVFIRSMIAHEIVCSNDAVTLLIEIGPIFLREHFKLFSEIDYVGLVFEDCFSQKFIKNTSALFREIVAEYACESEATNMVIMGDLYKLCACLLREFSGKNNVFTEQSGKNIKSITNIEKALELIHYDYKEQITIDYAAKLTGYSKSNFCKIFKNTVGMTFHAYLNSFRIKNACYFLQETDFPVNTIAESVGIPDTKTFCRIFKSVMSITAGEFRNSKQ